MWLIRRFILIFSVVLVPYLSKAQFVSERSAISNLEKGKWVKAKNQLEKILLKDSVHAGAEYVLARYFFSPSNPDFQIDSAYAHIQKAIFDYQQATTKEREKLLKLPVDTNVLVVYRSRIDSAAFERARQNNTESAYLDFLVRFKSASQKTQAITLRDQVSYADALKENTYEAFLMYTKKYPESELASEAKSNYDKLLFEAKTADQKLTTFETFLMEHPETPYRKSIEQQIFEKLTAGGEAASFERFLRKYPTSSKVREARNILYHLLKEDERVLIPTLMGDSIRSIQALDKHYLVPFLKNDRFGFMTDTGIELIKPVFKTIPDDYLCGQVRDEVLIGDDKIITRQGAMLYQGQVDEIDPLGYGFLLIRTGECRKVLHVSGVLLYSADCLQDAKLLSKNYLLLKKNNRWAIGTLTGKMLMDYEWNDIQLYGGVLSLKKGEKVRLMRMRDLAKIADQQEPTFSKQYDEVKPWNDGMLWVRAGHEQAVLNQSLSEWIKGAKQQISPSFFGAVSQTAAGYALHDKTSGSSPHYYRVKIQQPWIAVQQEGSWYRIDPNTRKITGEAYDSVNFVGPFFVGLKNDSLQIHLTPIHNFEFPLTAKTQFIPGKDSLFFLLIEESDKKTIYTIRGEKLFTIVADKVEYNNEGYFTITQKQKKGLISLNGKIILQPEYDATGSVTNDMVAILKDKKFGMIDLIRKKVIKPEYDKNITTYDKSRLIACRANIYALIGWDNKPITPFEFEEINYWNDSSALVKKNFQWLIYNFIEKRIVIDRIKNYKWIQDASHEKILIIQQENSYGVLSNKRGMVIPVTFSDIVNVGSESEPLYFTEKHVEEASIFVVIYYDKNGAQLRKYVYEGDDYEKIYCSGK